MHSMGRFAPVEQVAIVMERTSVSRGGSYERSNIRFDPSISRCAREAMDIYPEKKMNSC